MGFKGPVSPLLWLLAMLGCAPMSRHTITRDEEAGKACHSREAVSQEQLPFDRPELIELIEGLFAVEGDHPGASVMVLHDDRVITERHYGLASLEHGVPFTPHHVVRLPYSEGREFIAIAAVLMENDELIRLDDRVRDTFPRLPAWSDSVTIRDLIHHRSGFVDEWSALLLMHRSMANRLEESQFLRLLYDQPSPEIEPGTGYMYSNSDYGLLRLILEQAAGEPLSRYMKRRLFEPLEMSSTRLIDDFSAVIPNQAPFYAPDGDGYRHSDLKTSPGGDYVVATTACDLAKWAGAFASSTSEVSRAIGRLMDGAETLPGREGHYAFGYTVDEIQGTRVVRHEGVLEANYLTRIPNLGFTVITFSNRYYEPSENRAIVDFLLRSGEPEGPLRFPRDPVPREAEELARYAGRFVSVNVPSWESRTMARDLIQIEVVDGTLELDWSSWGRFRLVPVGAGTFSWHSGESDDHFGMLIELDDSSGEEPLELVIRYSDGFPEERFARLEPWRPSPELLQRLTGRYHSAHLDYTWTVLLDDAGELILRAPTLPDIRVEPYQEDEFLLRLEKFPGVPENVWIRFHENAASEITHLTVWHPRLMNHRFDRR